MSHSTDDVKACSEGRTGSGGSGTSMRLRVVRLGMYFIWDAADVILTDPSSIVSFLSSLQTP